MASNIDQVSNPMLQALVSGAIAGLTVDLTLFPLDSIKTRLQSKQGFHAAGGFRHIYAGMSSVAVGSAPGAALFFTTYEMVKTSFLPLFPHQSFAHAFAASIGEVAACIVRVPTEIIKQRSQATVAHLTHRKPAQVAVDIWKTQGIRGFYQGYTSTVLREIPFSLIQFPLWEMFKSQLAIRNARPVKPFEGAIAGSLAGAISAFVTTPLDVAKTRIMLWEKVHNEKSLTMRKVLTEIYTDRGIRGLFAGVVPRTLWMAIGGLVFFGAYEMMKSFFAVDHVVTLFEESGQTIESQQMKKPWSLRRILAMYYDGELFSFYSPKPRSWDQRIIESKIDFDERMQKRIDFVELRRINRDEIVDTD